MPKWLEQKLKNEGKEIKSKIYDYKKPRNPLAISKSASTKPKSSASIAKKKRDDMVDKNFDARNIFVIVDGQDILA
jgi:hypothetical protein